MEKIDPLISKFEETNSYVIYVLGTTASGKSQLAFDIAKRYNGVIINADSMQVYKKFGIMTAKPSEEEMSIVPHRLYDYVEIDSTDYSVNKWISDVEKEILNVLTEGKIPIICGGTWNYIRSLIFENQIDPEDEVVLFICFNNFVIYLNQLLISFWTIGLWFAKWNYKRYC